MARLNIIILACLIDEHRLISQTHAPCLVLSRAVHDALPSLGLRKGLVMLRATQGPSSLLSLIHAALPGMLSLLALSLPHLMLGRFSSPHFYPRSLPFNVLTTGSSKKCIFIVWGSSRPVHLEVPCRPERAATCLN